MPGKEAPAWLNIDSLMQNPTATPYPDVWKAIAQVDTANDGALVQMFQNAYLNRTIPTTPELFGYLIPRPIVYLQLKDHTGESGEYSPLTPDQWVQFVTEIMDDKQKKKSYKNYLKPDL